MKHIFFFLFATILINCLHAQTILLSDVAKYVGKKVTICGLVANVFDDRRANGDPTFLDMGKDYPNEQLTVLVWGENKSKFSYSLQSLTAKTICITGLIKVYRNRPEIVVNNPEQISKE